MYESTAQARLKRQTHTHTVLVAFGRLHRLHTHTQLYTIRTLVFGECAFLPFSVGPPGDCPWRHYGERESGFP